MLFEFAQQRAITHNERFSLHTLPAPKQESSRMAEVLGVSGTRQSVSGVLGLGLGETDCQWLEAQSIPYVAFGSVGVPDVRMVALELYEHVRDALDVLHSRGCERIACWTERPPEAWFLEGLLKHGVDLNHYESLQKTPPRGVSPQEWGFEIAMARFRRPRAEWPDGLWVETDHMAHGVLTALTRLNIEVGNEVQVAVPTNAGSRVLWSYENRLIRLEIDPKEIIEEMYASLELQIQGQAPTHLRLLRRALRL